MPNKIPVVFYNESNYDYHFVIKELADAFEGEFNCLGEKLKNKKIFSVIIEKEVSRTGKNGEEIIKTISYKLKFIANFLITNLLLVNMYLLAVLRTYVLVCASTEKIPNKSIFIKTDSATSSNLRLIFFIVFRKVCLPSLYMGQRRT